MTAPQSPYERVLQTLQNSPSGISAIHRDTSLHSAFQPIVSLSHCRAVGYEALVRAKQLDGSPVSPAELFGRISDEAEVIHLDRLCRALHIHNFIQTGDTESWIFLNVNPVASVQGRYYGEFFNDLLSHVGLPPERVVIEILENAVHDDKQLANSVDFYRDRGCLVAVDDFGTGHSNFGRVWQIKPHIVKLDRSTLVSARHNAAARRVLPGLVNILHEAGSIVLLEGIEDEFEAMLAMECGADLAQGYYFGRPEIQMATPDAPRDTILGLVDTFRQKLQLSREKRSYATHISAMLGAITSLQFDASLQCPEVDIVLALPGSERCYLLNDIGQQVGPSRVSINCNITPDKRFRPMDKADDAVWIRRAYWHRALAKPNEVQITRPYISLATGRLSVTLSICFSGSSGVLVLCHDIHIAED